MTVVGPPGAVVPWQAPAAKAIEAASASLRPVWPPGRGRRRPGERHSPRCMVVVMGRSGAGWQDQGSLGPEAQASNVTARGSRRGTQVAQARYQ
jgi:hypothetical protein